jgi:uncharacterized membrane protein
MSWLSKFLPDEHSRRLFPGFVAFCVGLLGVAMGFIATQFEIELLGKLGYMIVVFAVVWGFIFIVTGWFKAVPEILKAFTPKPKQRDTKRLSDE